MNHLCFHPNHGPHQCHCGLEMDHAHSELWSYYNEQRLTPLESEIC